MTIALSDRVRVRTDVFSTSVDDDLVLFDPEQGTYFGAGSVGSVIWQKLSGDKTVEQICADLMDQFSVDADTCHQDVLSFLNDALERGLVEIENKSG